MKTIYVYCFVFPKVHSLYFMGIRITQVRITCIEYFPENGGGGGGGGHFWKYSNGPNTAAQSVADLRGAQKALPPPPPRKLDQLCF